MFKVPHILLRIFLCSVVPAIAFANNPDDDTSGTALPVQVPSFVYLPDSSFLVNEDVTKAGLLYDAVNQKIVWQKNMTTVLPIASLTKMMVSLLALEDIQAGAVTWDDKIAWVRSTVVGRRKKRRTVKTNVSYTLKDVFKATMIASNNECSEQLAKYLGKGNLQSTIDRMNQRARELGMMNTFYGNPSGLPAPNGMFDNSSSPVDLLHLALECLKHPEMLEIAGMGYASIDDGRSESVIRNHNGLTIDYKGEVDGLKTGYTRRAGFCLVATTAKCDHRLVSIVLGCRNPQIRNELVKDMINNYYLSIGLDKLGPYSPSPSQPQLLANGDEYTFVSETVKKIHRVRRGETLSGIASRYHCTTTQLKNWNKRTVRSVNRIDAGDHLVVYTKQIRKIPVSDPVNGTETEDDKPMITKAEKNLLQKEEEIADSDTQAPVPVKSSDAKYIYHTIEPGDTLFSISKSYEGVTISDLKELNNIKNVRNLRPGMKIKVKVQG